MAPQQPFLKKQKKQKTQHCVALRPSRRGRLLFFFLFPAPCPTLWNITQKHKTRWRAVLFSPLKQTKTKNTERNVKVKKKSIPSRSQRWRWRPGERPERLLRRPDLNSAAPRLSGSSLRLLRQFGGGISEGGADRLANMFSGGICIMSAVHRQRSCSAPVPPLVIYLAVLLKCSCRWHWLTNQTVKTRPEYQSAAVLFFFFGGVGGNICLSSAFGLRPVQIKLMRLTFFFFFPRPQQQEGSPRFFLGFVRGRKPERKEAAALDFCWRQRRVNICRKSDPPPGGRWRRSPSCAAASSGKSFS